MTVDEDHDMHLGAALWVGIGAAVIGLVVLVLALTRRSSAPDLGSVSSQWIAEQRANQAGGSVR